MITVYAVPGGDREVRATLELGQDRTAVSLMVDCGAKVSLLSRQTTDRIAGAVTSPTTTKLRAYGGLPIQLSGVTELEVRYGDKAMQHRFFVAPGGDNIIGRDLMEKLGFRVDLSGQLPGIAAVSDLTADLQARYPATFSGAIGCCAGAVHQPKVDPAVRPIQQPLRRLPLMRQEQVGAELDKMEKDGIIERVLGLPGRAGHPARQDQPLPSADQRPDRASQSVAARQHQSGHGGEQAVSRRRDRLPVCIPKLQAQPRESQGKSPAELMLGRKWRTTITMLSPGGGKTMTEASQALRQQIEDRQLRIKAYTDSRRRGRPETFHPGEWVRIRRPTKKGKLGTRLSQPLQVLRQAGHHAFELSDGTRWNQQRLIRTPHPAQPRERFDPLVDLAPTTGAGTGGTGGTSGGAPGRNSSAPPI